MSTIKLKWSNLLKLTELEFEPEAPKVLSVSDEVVQSLSWLTGATRHDRRLLRCDENGALLVTDPWVLLNPVQEDELNPFSANEDSVIYTLENTGVLIATSTAIVKVGFVRVKLGDTEWIYVPPASFYWFHHSVYSITVHCVPDPSGDASYVGVTAFN